MLENVRPASGAPASHGYIHAPSLGQAATAAVLRSGTWPTSAAPTRRSRSTSPRAASASRSTLLDGVRDGQPLGALLGYRLERGLHEDHPGLALDRYIAALRALAPLDAITVAEHELRVAPERQARGRAGARPAAPAERRGEGGRHRS